VGGAKRSLYDGANPAIRRALPYLVAVAVILVVSVHGSGQARADWISSIQDGVMEKYSGWLTNAVNLAWQLFAVAGVTGAIVIGVGWYAKNSTWEGVQYPLTDTIFRLIIPAALLKTVGTFMPAIFSIATRIASGVTGEAITGPGSLLHQGLMSAAALFNACTQPLTNALGGPLVGGIVLTTNPLMWSVAIVGAVAAGIIFLAFAFIAAELLLAIVNILITSSIGAISLGWAAAPGTAPMASAYWQAVWAGIFRLVTTYCVAQFITTAATQAFALPPNLADLPAMLVNAGGAVAFALASVYLVVRIPSLAEHAFTGRAILTGEAFVGHMTSPAKLVVSKLAKAGAR
jgi:hypothetical protein